MPAKYLLIGSGIASLSAAETIRTRSPQASIVLVSEEPHDFYSRPGLAYLLRGDIPERQLFIRSREELRSLNLQRLTARVRKLWIGPHEVELDSGDRLDYDRLLLATGATAAPPPFPGGDLKGVVKIDSLSDTQRILEQVGRGKTAVVVGGGITALELAEGLQARRMKVHYFLRGDRYWADVLDEIESRIVMDRLRHDGIKIHTNTQVKEAFGRRGWLTGVETQDGREYDCDLLAVAIGVQPRLELARQAELNIERGVLVNPYMQTSAPDVYAAGDVAQVREANGNRLPMDVLWPTALIQGRIAGSNMVGDRIAYFKDVPLNVTQLAGLRVTIIGSVGKGKADQDLLTIARGDSQAWRQDHATGIVAETENVNRVRLMIGPRQIVGALVMGDQTWSTPLQHLITARVDVSSIRDELAEGGAKALSRLALFFQQWQHAESLRAGAR